jgi:hypothetical protein
MVRQLFATSWVRRVAGWWRYRDRCTRERAGQDWEIYVVDEVLAWIERLDDATHARVVQAIDALAEGGPLGRPLVDTIVGSRIQNLKELRPGTVRILFVFDPWRSSVLLVAGDDRYLKERQAEEDRP